VGVVYRGAQLDATLSGDRVTLQRAEAQSKKGRLELSGDVRVISLTQFEPNLTVKASDFLFTDTADLRLLASGDLRLSGTMAAPEVRGQVTASGCSYTLPPSALAEPQAASAIKLTPDDIRMMEETFGYQTASTALPMQGLFEASDLDLQVSLGRDNWVRKRTAPRLTLEVTGQVRARKTPHGELDLEGRVAPVPGRSSIEQFGRTFDFTGGEVLLNGGMKDHTIDIRTEYKPPTRSDSDEPEVIVHLDLRGELDRMELELSSEPPLSETEIISYVMTGRSPIKPQTGSDKSGSDAAALATDIGLSQVTGALEGVVQGKAGLDVMQVRYDGLNGATLVAGRYVEPTLYVGLQQPLQYRDTGDQSSQNPYQTVVELEYEAYGWLVLNLQAETSLLRTFLRASHAY
jgi:translocation and assembly module TamB